MSAALVAAIEKLAERIARLEKAARQPERKAYRPSEVAAMTGIGYKRVLELCQSGELRSLHDGRLYIVPADAITEFLGQRVAS